MKTTTSTPVPGLTFALSELTQIFAKGAPKLPPSANPKFQWPTEPINKLDPWKHFDKHECVGLYVVRDIKGLPDSVEVVVEIESFRFTDKTNLDDEGDVTLGNCFRVMTGEQDWLTLEEEDEAKEAFKNSFGTNYEADLDDARD